MQQFTLEFSSSKQAEKYLENYFRKNKVEYKKEKSSGAAYCFHAERNVFLHSFSVVLTTVYKQKNVLFRREKTETELFCACVGAVLSMERETERGYLEERGREYTAVNLDGFYNFEMNDMRKEWESIGFLTNRLYEKCRVKEEYISLLLYFLDLEMPGTDVLVRDGKLFQKITGEELEICPIFADKRENLIANLFLHRPSEITVDGRQNDKKFLELVTMVGTQS